MGFCAYALGPQNQGGLRHSAGSGAGRLTLFNSNHHVSLSTSPTTVEPSRRHRPLVATDLSHCQLISLPSTSAVANNPCCCHQPLSQLAISPTTVNTSFSPSSPLWKWHTTVEIPTRNHGMFPSYSHAILQSPNVHDLFTDVCEVDQCAHTRVCFTTCTYVTVCSPCT